MEKVTIYTDGSCHGNPGPGGYAAIVQMADGTTVHTHGSDWYTTNNRMELTAVAEGLKLVSGPSDITIFTDSKYVVDLINRKDLKEFVRNPQKKNTDLLKKIIELTGRHKIAAKWVKGHAGNNLNEQCDQMANKEVDSLKQEREVRRFVIAALLADKSNTPKTIADRYPGIVSVGTVEKYYNQYLRMMEDCHVTGK